MAAGVLLYAVLAWTQEAPDRQADRPSALQHAASLRRTGDWAQALSELKVLWGQDPSDPVGALAFGNLALMDGQPAEAEAPLRGVARSASPLAPFARLLLAQALHAQAKNDDAAVELQPLLAADAVTPPQGRALRLLADVQRDLGRRNEEVATWRRILSTKPPRGEEAAARYRLAQALEAAGQARSAFEAYQEIYWGRGLSPYARQAGLEATRLARAKGFPLRAMTPRQTYEAADRFLHAGRAADALDLLDAIPPRAIRGDLAPDVGLLRVQVLYALRENGKAVAEADQLLKDAGPQRHALVATLKAVWALLRSGDHEGILARGKKIIESAGNNDALRGEALYCMGTSAYTSGRFAEAAGYLGQIEGLKNPSPNLTAAQLKRAWCLYRTGDVAGARALFASLAVQSHVPNIAQPASFWSARCALELGQAASAAEGLTHLASEPPGYWSWRAREALAAMRVALPAEPAFGPPPDPDAALALPGAELAKTLDLCGLDADAARAFGPVYAANRGQGPAAVAFALLLTRGGDAGGGRAVLRRAFGPVLDRFSVEKGWLEAACPTPYLGLVRADCAREGLDPAFAYGIIQQESDFDEDAVSPTNARGLMQLMSYTAAKLAADLGRPAPSDGDLLNPLLNLDLGIRYLARRTREFEPAAAAASYNAGEDIVGGWVKGWGPTGEEEFIAMVPYSETRHYAAVVLWNRHRYQQLLGTP
jgi:soluble lytic murein transglycosylase-like protein